MLCRKIFLINASPRPEGHTQQILNAAKESLAIIPGVETISGSVCGDNFEEAAAMWLKADGIILGSPVYSYGPPSEVYAFFKYLRSFLKAKGAETSLPKPIGLISQGGASYSGAEENANLLQALVLSVGCAPVSGDMPGFSQAVIGQVNDQGDVDQSLLDGAAGLAVHVVEMVDILDAGKDPRAIDVRLLVVTAGTGSAPELTESVFNGAAQAPNCNLITDVFHFVGNEIAPCKACTQYCSKDLECIYDDGMQEFRAKWLLADAVVWLVGADEFGIDPGLIATIDRMNQTRFEILFATGQPLMPRYVKSVGVLASGNRPERIASAVRFLRQAAVLYQNVLLPQDGLGGCGIWPDQLDSLLADASQKAAELGMLSVKLASCLKSGLAAQSESLPAAYFPSKVKYGVAEKKS